MAKLPTCSPEISLGRYFAFCSGERLSAAPAPWQPAPEWKINNPGHLNRVGAVGHPPRGMPVQPRRLGHTLRFTADLDKQTDFYTRIVGMKLSDRAADIVSFMRSGEGGSDHHVLGFIKSDRPGFHHASFEVANLDELGVGACRMLDKGYRNGWGMGRHVIGYEVQSVASSVTTTCQSCSLKNFRQFTADVANLSDVELVKRFQLDYQTAEALLPALEINLAVADDVLAQRRKAEEARGKDAYTPHNRKRVVSAALQAYAALVTSADTGAVRDLGQIRK